MRVLTIAALLSTACAWQASCASASSDRVAATPSVLLTPTRLSKRPVDAGNALKARDLLSDEGSDANDVGGDARLESRDAIIPIQKEKQLRRRLNAMMMNRGRNGIVSPTGSEFLFLDFLRFSAYEQTVRSDGVFISNTSLPAITVSLGEEKDNSQATHHTNNNVTVEVPHIVQVWAVRVPSADGSNANYDLSPDSDTRFYFAVEHTPTEADRSTITGEVAPSLLKTDDAAPSAAATTALPFIIKGGLYPSPAAGERDSDVPAWMSTLGAIKASAFGKSVTTASRYAQQAILGFEERAKQFWRGEVSMASVFNGGIGEFNGFEASSSATGETQEGGAALALSFPLTITNGRLVSMDAESPTKGAFVVEIAGTSRFDGASDVPPTPFHIRLSGNYTFNPTREFMTNPKINAFTAHNFFEYSLTFAAGGPIAQESVSDEKSNQKKSQLKNVVCTHYRAVAQFDKRHLVITTFWKFIDENEKKKDDTPKKAASVFEQTIVLNLQETAGVDVRFSAENGQELDEDEHQRFRFMDAFIAASPQSIDNNGALSSLAAKLNAFATVKAADSAASIIPIVPKLRRVQLPAYYLERDADGNPTAFDGASSSSSSSNRFRRANSGLFDQYLPFGSRIKRLFPTIALLIIVTLVKLGPKFYLNWLDAKQQRRKGALSMKEAMAAQLERDIQRAKTMKRTTTDDGAAANTTLLASSSAEKEKGMTPAQKAAAAKRYGSGEHLAKAEAILNAQIAKDPKWREKYQEAMARRKQLTPEELADLREQEKALVEQMKREDGLL